MGMIGVIGGGLVWVAVLWDWDEEFCLLMVFAVDK